MNKMLRHIAAIVLLATYLPMVMLSSLHVHHESADTNDNCLHCVGHYEAQHHHHSDCQYCNFLSLNYLSQDHGQRTTLQPSHATFATHESAPINGSHHGVALLRAPPEA